MRGDVVAGANNGVPEVRDISPAGQDAPLMERLKYGTDLHGRVLGRLKSRRDLARRFTELRWDDYNRVNEHLRLYVNLSRQARHGDRTEDSIKKEISVKRSIVVPVSYAVLAVRMAQLMGIFTGRKPLFELSGRGPEDVRGAKLMETVLDYDAEQGRYLLALYAHLQDSEKYGLGITYDSWDVCHGWTRKKPSQSEMVIQAVSRLMGITPPPLRTWDVTREFNSWMPVSPYWCWFDPRVPKSDLQLGEFCGHRFWRGLIWLKERSQENGGIYFNLDYLGNASGDDGPGSMAAGDYSSLSTAYYLKGSDAEDDRGFYALDHLQVKLIPRDWQLSPETKPEIWWFTWADDKAIVRAHRSAYEHGQYTYGVSESCYDPHELANPGTIENLDGLQRFTDWLFNSHVDNIRKNLNDAMFYCPSLIEEADLLNPGPARYIRMSKMAEQLIARGQLAIGQAFQQLNIQDITRPHLEAIKIIFDMVQRMTATNDPMMGQTTQDQRTLGEINHIVGAASQRVGIQARMIEAQAIFPMIYRAISNRQQFSTMQQFIRISGELSEELGGQDRFLVRPWDLQGQFDYIPQSDLLPRDPADQAQTWTNIMLAASKVPQLLQPGPDGKMLDVRSVFNEAARSMGIKNIQQFYISVRPDDEVAAGVQAGNIIPFNPQAGAVQ